MSRQSTPLPNLLSPSDLLSTPHSKKHSGQIPYSSTTTTRNGRFRDMWSEIHDHVVGPMPVKEFLHTFLGSSILPTDESVLLERVKAFACAAKDGKYEGIVNALQPIFSNLEIRDTHEEPKIAFQDIRIAPDFCIVNRGMGFDSIADAEIFMELKPNDSDDPFYDGSGLSNERVSCLVKETDHAKHILGQTTVYAAAQQAAQFRTHIFSVLIFPQHSRLLRWDRSGVIVTEKISTSSLSFIKFLQLYDAATLEQRGVDVSVTAPSDKDKERARKCLGVTETLVQFSVDPSNGSYIVPIDALTNHTRSPLGRSTRTFIAYSISRKCKCFLKDSWRLASQTPEHKIYSQLYDKQVQHIPTVLDGADILEQATLTQDILKEKPEWIRAPPAKLRKHKHYRLVLKEIAHPLVSFPSTKVLVSAIRDAMKAHRAAYLKAGVLHRDISAGNIMIHDDGSGLLLDWDLSKSTREGEGAREWERTGTWQFISAELLKNPTAVQSHIDDLESFIHVITWISFGYARHQLDPAKLGLHMRSVFDHSFRAADGLAKGGEHKTEYLLAPSKLHEAGFTSNLQTLLKQITYQMSIRYRPPLELMVEGRGSEELFQLLQQARREDVARLKSPKWLISKFNSALSLPDWPLDDRSELNPIEKLVIEVKGQSSTSSLKRSGSKGGGSRKNDKRLRSFPS